MKRIILLRHGKAENQALDEQDIDRRLDPRGQAQTRSTGLDLLAKGVRVDRVLCSPSARTRQTCAILSETLGLPPGKVTYPKELYLAAPFDLMGQLCSLPATVNTVMVVGHNPGLSELAASFSRRIGLLATAGMAMIDVDIKEWPDLASYPTPVHVDWSDKLA